METEVKTRRKIQLRMPGRRTATGKNVNWILMKRNKVLYLFILPAFLYFLIFSYVPMYGVQIAFKDFVANKGFLGSEWADPLFKHFITFFSSVNFWEILRNTIGLSLYYLAISFPMPILLALMINEVKNTRFKKAVQNITYMPYFVSTVVLVGMINLFFSYNGLANNIGALFGAEPQMFLMKDALFNDLYVWSGVWQATGYGAVIYIGWIFAGIPFIFLYNMVAAIMRALGDSKTPLYFLILTSALNIGLDLLFIVPFHFGVLGAGMGTALACALVSLAMGWCCCVRNAQLRLRRGEAHAFRPEILKKAFRIGAPVAVQEIAMNGAMVASTMILAPLGAAAIAANSFAVTAESLCYMPGYGVGSAATTLVGRSVGAGDAVQARRYGNICTALGGALMGCTGLLMMIFCPFVFRLLTPVAEVRTLAAQALRIGLLAEPLFGVSIAAAGALRGAGELIKSAPAEKHLLILLTDASPDDSHKILPSGKVPLSRDYDGQIGVDDTAEEVRALRAQGIRVAAVFMGENASVPAANAIYGRDLARIRRIDQLAATAGRLIQDEIRELSS